VTVFVRGKEGVFVDGILRRWSTAGFEFGGLLCVRTLPLQESAPSWEPRGVVQTYHHTPFISLGKCHVHYNVSNLASYSARDADVTR
jgi:hypothetical protein